MYSISGALAPPKHYSAADPRAKADYGAILSVQRHVGLALATQAESPGPIPSHRHSSWRDSVTFLAASLVSRYVILGSASIRKRPSPRAPSAELVKEVPCDRTTARHGSSRTIAEGRRPMVLVPWSTVQHYGSASTESRGLRVYTQLYVP